VIAQRLQVVPLTTDERGAAQRAQIALRSPEAGGLVPPPASQSMAAAAPSAFV